MRNFFGIFLLLVAILSGGCSLVFTTTVFQDLGGSSDVVIIWVLGLLMGGLSLWGAIALLRGPAVERGKAPVPPGPKDGTEGQ